MNIGLPAQGSILIIGYGSTLRGDDAVGPKVAEMLEQRNLSGIEVIACHQLTPELADPISRARFVVFVDAAVDLPSPEVQVSDLEPIPQHQVMVHTTSPSSLLHMARSVFGTCPPARMVRIPVQNLEIGEELSALAEQGVIDAAKRIEELAQSLRSQRPS